MIMVFNNSDMFFIIRNSIRNSVKPCGPLKTVRFKSSVVTCPFSRTSVHHDRSPERGIMGSALEGNGTVDVNVNVAVDDELISNETETDVATAKPFADMPSPGGFRDIPIVGPLFHFKPFTNYTVSTIHNLFNDLHDRYGKIYRLKLPNWTVVTEDPDDMELVFRNEGPYPERPPFDLYRTYSRRRKIPPNVGHIDGEQWKRLRGRIQKKLLKTDSASKYIAGQNTVAEELVLQLRSTNLSPADIKEMFFKYSAEAISFVCFEKRLGFLSDKVPRENEIYLEAVKQYFDVLASHFGSLPLFKLLPTPTYKKFEAAADIVYRFAGDHARQTLEKCIELKKSGKWDQSHLSFPEAILSYEDSTVEELTSMMQDLIIGGTDSTAKVIESTLYHLAINPEKQNNLFGEIDSVIGRSRKVETGHLHKLKYVKACIKETKRMQFPTPIGTGRILQKDLVLGGYNIPKGVTVMINNPRLLKNPKYFKDCELFVPERWLRDENGVRECPIPAMAMKPFGFGIRRCVGEKFAEQEIILSITKLIQNFKVSVKPGDKEPKVIYNLFGNFSEPVNFLFKPR